MEKLKPATSAGNLIATCKWKARENVKLVSCTINPLDLCVHSRFFFFFALVYMSVRAGSERENDFFFTHPHRAEFFVSLTSHFAGVLFKRILEMSNKPKARQTHRNGFSIG